MISNNGESEILTITCLIRSVHSNLIVVKPCVVCYLYRHLCSAKKDNTPRSLVIPPFAVISRQQLKITADI